MASTDAATELQRQLRERDRLLFEAEGRIADLETELRESKTAQTRSEAEAARLRRELANVEERLQKSKRAERAAATELARTQSSLSANVLRRAESSAAVAQAPAQQPSPSPSAPGTDASEERARLWKLTAQVVLESYKTRLDVVVAEGAARDDVVSLRAGEQTTLLGSLEHRLAAARRAATAVEQLAEGDEQRRIAQFHELTSLREQLLMAERGVSVRDRDIASLDGTIVELRAEVRALEKDRRTLQLANEDLEERIGRLSQVVGAVATTAPGPKGAKQRPQQEHHQQERQQQGRNGASSSSPAERRPVSSLGAADIIENSELRAETASLREQLAAVVRDRDEALQVAQDAKAHFAEAQARLTALHRESLGGRAALATSLGAAHTDDAAVQQQASAQQRLLEAHVRQMSDRVRSLEELVRHKDRALQVAQLQARQSERTAAASDASFSLSGPYGRGLRLPSAPPARSASRSLTGANSASSSGAPNPAAVLQHAQPFRL